MEKSPRCRWVNFQVATSKKLTPKLLLRTPPPPQQKRPHTLKKKHRGLKKKIKKKKKKKKKKQGGTRGPVYTLQVQAQMVLPVPRSLPRRRPITAKARMHWLSRTALSHFSPPALHEKQRTSREGNREDGVSKEHPPLFIKL